MTHAAFTLFDTALGRYRLLWGASGIIAVAFPGEDDAKMRARLGRRHPLAREDDPDGEICAVIEAIGALFAGQKPDLSFARLDMDGLGEFERKVYRLTRAILPGETRTYGDIARALGDVGHSQRVGQALGRNPFPIIVPCHRVLGAQGRLTGFSAPGGIEMKRRLLKIEGALGPELFD